MREKLLFLIAPLSLALIISACSLLVFTIFLQFSKRFLRRDNSPFYLLPQKLYKRTMSIVCLILKVIYDGSFIKIPLSNNYMT